jgi:predicted acyltransferase
MKQLKRLVSLDVFRGITVVLMIIVNSPGTLNPYSLLAHSNWDGCTLADLVFPFFIVIVGISSVIALNNFRAKGLPRSALIAKVFQRSLYIFLVGLLLNAFPYHFDLTSIRYMGVLQRIAICYCVSALLFLTMRIQTQVVVFVGLLVGYALMMTGFSPINGTTSPLSLEGNLAGYIDRMFISPTHLYTTTFDPEGLFSTLPAIASVLLGNLIGVFLYSSRTPVQKVQWTILMGTLLCAIGWFWSLVLPFNKALWSSAYVLWTGGLAMIVFAIIYALIEIKQWTRWSVPFNVFGRQAMLVYVLHVLFLKIQTMVHFQHLDGTIVNLRIHLTEQLFGYWSPQIASLLYSLSYTLLWLLVLIGITAMKRRRYKKITQCIHF